MAKDDAVGFALSRDTVAPTGPDFFPPVTTEDINPSINEMTHEATQGTRAPEAVQRGGRTYAGGINGGARPDSFPAFLAWAMGDATTTQPNAAGAATVYRHEYNPVGTGKKPLPATVWTDNKVEGTTDIVDKYDFTYLNELGISVEPNDYLLYTAGVIAKRLTDNAGVMPAVTRAAAEATMWRFDEVIAELKVGAGAWTAHALANFGMTFGNGFSADNFGLGSLETRAIRAGNITLGVTFSAFDTIEAHYRRALLQTPEYVGLRITARGRKLYDTTPDTNDLYEEFGIQFERLQYTEAPINISATDVLVSIPVTTGGAVTPAGALLSAWVQNENAGAKYKQPVA